MSSSRRNLKQFPDLFGCAFFFFPRPSGAPPSTSKGALQRHQLLGMQLKLSAGYVAYAHSFKFTFEARM